MEKPVVFRSVLEDKSFAITESLSEQGLIHQENYEAVYNAVLQSLRSGGNYLLAEDGVGLQMIEVKRIIRDKDGKIIGEQG